MVDNNILDSVAQRRNIPAPHPQEYAQYEYALAVLLRLVIVGVITIY
jgi:hypothetical protein